MFKSIQKKLFNLVSFILLISFLLLASNECFSQNVDKWNDQSGDLSGTSNTWIYITVVVVAVAAIVYFVFIAPSKDKSKDKSSELKNFNFNKFSTLNKDFKSIKSDFKSIKYLKSENLKDILKEGIKQKSLFKNTLTKIEIPEYHNGLVLVAEKK